MKTVTYSTDFYAFSELSEEAQEYAISHWRMEDSWPWWDDWYASLQAIAERIGAQVKNAEVGYRPHVTVLTGRDGTMWHEDRKEVAHQAYVSRSCGFTGFHADGILSDAWDEVKRTPGVTWYHLYRRVAERWQRAAQADYEWWFSAEVIREELEELENEIFTKEGRR